MRTVAICFGQFGPYHHARVVALQRAAEEVGVRVIPVQISSDTATYAWSGAERKCQGLQTLCTKVEEEVSPLEVFLKARKLFREEKVEVAFLPSYSPARFFALFAAAKSLGIRTVMMNESHAGTEQATGWKRWIKRQIVKQFGAALVGGEPHKRHFASLGIPSEKIFTGYDAVDNDFFAARADEIRAAAKKSRQLAVGSSRSEKDVREAYGLPERYFLSLGRMVEKKNLSTLVEAYARFARASGERSKAEAGNLKPELLETADGGDAAATNAVNCKLKTEHCPPGLVFVGSGELEGALREQARGLGLRVIDRTNWKAGQSSHGLTRINTDKSERLAADRTVGDASCRVTPALADSPREKTDDCELMTDDSAAQRGAVFFYGFRQIEENPVFYALAEAFVLPSLKEEWGLVVNEAMAAGLPVIVSRAAGCAEDLVPAAPASRSSQLAVGSVQSGEGKKTDDCKLTTDDSLEERSNGFVFDPKSSDALSEALRRIADQKTKSLTAESSRQPEAKPRANQETDGLTEMGKRSREIVAKFSCENFARQALRAAEAASA